MKPASAVQSGASVQTREASRPTLSSEAPVFEQRHQAGQVPEKFDASSSGLSLPTTPSTVCGRIGPVDEHADHRVVDRAELGDRLIRAGQVALDHVRRSPQLLGAATS